MKRLVLTLIFVLFCPVLIFAADQITFKLNDTIYGCDSPSLQKDLWVAAAMDMSEGTDKFDKLLYNHMRHGRIIRIPANTAVTMTSRVTGIAVEITTPGRDGKWSIPA